MGIRWTADTSWKKRAKWLYKKILDLISHQRNASWNHDDTLFGTIRLEKLKSVTSSVSKDLKANSPQTSLEGNINSYNPLENNWASPSKGGNARTLMTLQPPAYRCTCAPGDSQKTIHSSTIWTRKKWKHFKWPTVNVLRDGGTS